jgi:hypothetical protein
MDGREADAEALHRDRFRAVYQEEVNPRSFVEVVVDNTDFDHPRLLRSAPCVGENVSPSSW